MFGTPTPDQSRSTGQDGPELGAVYSPDISRAPEVPTSPYTDPATGRVSNFRPPAGYEEEDEDYES